jgi:ABC-type multidrug transport system fused ATPase/permease subunit
VTLDTVLTERGANFSTGQRQLISFARALISDPRILILDEATAHVDTLTEQKVQRALAELLKGRTSFVIAHRLSTIRNADQIIVIGKGRILEQGTHEELLALKGEYWQLSTSQMIAKTE